MYFAINNIKHDTKFNYISKNSISFKGQLEDDYFKAAKNNDTQSQIRALKNLGFDISETDLETNSNFLHFAIKSQNDSVINQALLLLSKKKAQPEIVSDIVGQKDSTGKTPCEYATNEATIKRIEKIIGKTIQTKNAAIQPNVPAKDGCTDEVILNELPIGYKISIPSLDDDDDELPYMADTSVQTETEKADKKQEIDLPVVKLENIAGHNKAKAILLDRIVKPLEDGQIIHDNGFLIHDTIGNGKSFLLNSLAVSLNRQILNEKLFDEALDDLMALTKNDRDKYKKGLADIFKKYIIQVSDLQELEKVIDVARKNYQYNKQQAIIFIDEIKGILPDISAPSSQGVTKAEQLIENSSKKGFVLVATTREIGAIKPESIRYGRFDKKIELRPPNEKERVELISQYYKGSCFLPPSLSTVTNKNGLFLLFLNNISFP